MRTWQMIAPNRRALWALVAIVSGLTSCMMMGPLQDEHLQIEAQDPRISIVLMRFKTEGAIPDRPYLARDWDNWVFAVSNESTGWNFRRLDQNSMIFRTGDNSLEPDESGLDAGWVTLLAPPGLNYITVTSVADAENNFAPDFVVTPLTDHISVAHSTGQANQGASESGWKMIDFIGTPRFAVDVLHPRSLIYAGTIVRTLKCASASNRRYQCPYDLSIVSENGLAKDFIKKYQKNFPAGLSLQTQLLTIPQSRTIEIHGGSQRREQDVQRNQ